MEKNNLIPPEKDLADKTHEYFKEIIKAISGSVLNPLVDFILPSFHQKQFDRWCQNVYSAIIELEEKKITLDDLRGNSEFISILKEALVIASRSHQTEKLEILKNSIFNSLGNQYAFDTKFIFTKIIDKLSLAHLIVFIIIFRNPENFKNINKYQEIYDCVLLLKPDLAISKGELIYILNDLELHSLIQVSKDIEDEEIVRQHESFTMVAENKDLPYIAITNFGEKFYSYVT